MRPPRFRIRSLMIASAILAIVMAVIRAFHVIDLATFVMTSRSGVSSATSMSFEIDTVSIALAVVSLALVVLAVRTPSSTARLGRMKNADGPPLQQG